MSRRLRPDDRYPGRIDNPRPKPSGSYDITNMHRYFEPVGDEEKSYIALACNSRAELIKQMQALDNPSEPKPTNTFVPESTGKKPPYVVDQEPER